MTTSKTRHAPVALGALTAFMFAAPAFAQDADNASGGESEVNPIVVDGDGADPVVAEPEEITDRNHPDYIRCRSEPVIGSLARRRRVCMTNAEWAEASRAGNQGSRDLIEQNQPGFMITDPGGGD